MNLEIDLSGVDLTPGENIANLVYEENGVSWVDVENLKPNPLNKLIYANDTAETTKLRNSQYPCVVRWMLVIHQISLQLVFIQMV